ncbi:hypothetical protein [Sinorhizobium medicae]|uniref:hypothetical protein n=1 Tax=Sinorhizobium medicae TaxID=110321 RepID=UPI0011B5716A|nr:hypothetical protein [Sinorhizobium medicae]
MKKLQRKPQQKTLSIPPDVAIAEWLRRQPNAQTSNRKKETQVNTPPKEIATAAIRNSSSKSWSIWRGSILAAAAVVLVSTTQPLTAGGGLEYHNFNGETDRDTIAEGNDRDTRTEGNDRVQNPGDSFIDILRCGFYHFPDCPLPK